MRSVEPLYSKITNPTSTDNGRGSIPSIQELYKGLSLTSQFKVSLDLHRQFRGSDSVDGHLTRSGVFDEYNSTSYSYDFFASEAILPGVNFDMTEMPGAYQGMLEYVPTRRIWPDVEITFYVDKKYNMLRLFEEWMNYINPLYSSSGQYTGGIHGQDLNGFDEYNAYYKMRYPGKYKKELIISKFERDFLKDPNEARTRKDHHSKWNRGQMRLSYKLIDAFPKQVTSVPVSYNGSTLTQVTVVFGYTRYITIKDNGNLSSKSRGSWMNYKTNPRSNRSKVYSDIRPQTNNSFGNFGDYSGLDTTNLNPFNVDWFGENPNPWNSGLDWQPIGDYSGLDTSDLNPWGIWGQPPKPVSSTQTQVNLDNSRYGNTFPAGSFGITSNQSSPTSGLSGFKTEPQNDAYAPFIP